MIIVLQKKNSCSWWPWQQWCLRCWWINTNYFRFPPRWTCFLWSIKIAFTTTFTGSACRFRSSSFYELVQLAQVSNFATTRVAHSIWKHLRVLCQLQSYLPTNVGKNDAKTIFTLWRLEKIFRRRMALFASNISEFNFKRNVAKPAVVTRTFFRHLNIVALKVCRVDNTCIICFCRKWISSSGKELLHFHWLIFTSGKAIKRH